jgi:hypothetical protein
LFFLVAKTQFPNFLGKIFFWVSFPSQKPQKRI